MPGDPADDPPVRLDLVPARSDLSPGDRLRVRVEVTEGRAITSVPLHVRFDPAVLEYVGATTGPALREGTHRPILLASVSPQRPDDLAVGLSLVGDSGTFTGSGALILLEFRALQPGTSRLAPERASVLGATGEPLPSRIGGCTVRVR
jgi:hypothetical protein